MQNRGVSVKMTDLTTVMVTIHKDFGHVIENTIPQNHQFVNSLFVILGKKGVIIYNFFLFCPKGRGKCPKQDSW